MTTPTRQYLNTLEIGDTVVVKDNWYHSQPRTGKIERMTTTMFIVSFSGQYAPNHRYNRKTGKRVGWDEYDLSTSCIQAI